MVCISLCCSHLHFETKVKQEETVSIGNTYSIGDIGFYPPKKDYIFVYLSSLRNIKPYSLHWSDKTIIDSIKDGQDDGLVHLYRTLRDEFIQWARKIYNVDEEIGSDAFQESILAFRFNVAHGRISEMTSSIKTYLFAIGKNQILNVLKKKKHEVPVDDFTKIRNESLIIRDHKDRLSERQEKIRNMIHKMEEPCLSILRMFYYLGYSMDVIAARMDYKNENVAKTQKSRCIAKLRENWT